MSSLSSHEKQTLYGIFNTYYMEWYIGQRFSDKQKLIYSDKISEARMFATREDAEYCLDSILIDPTTNHTEALKFRLRILPITLQIIY